LVVLDDRRELMVQSQRYAGKVAGSAYVLSFAAPVFAQFRTRDRIIVNRSGKQCRARMLRDEKRTGSPDGSRISAGRGANQSLASQLLEMSE
jgi:hypothetical protein